MTHDPDDLAEWQHMLDERIGILLDSGMRQWEAELIGRQITEDTYRESRRLAEIEERADDTR